MFLVPTSLFGQSKRDILYKENLAKEYFNASDFKDALSLFLELDSLNPTGNYDFQIGMSYINLHNNDKALPYFQRCLKNSSKHPATLYYYAGKAFHLSHQLDSAISNYTKFKNNLNLKSGKKYELHNQKVLAEIDREIASCEYGKELMANPQKIEIMNLGPEINSPYPDYAAVLSADESEMVFTSNRPGTTGGGIDPHDGLGLYYEDIYISYKSENGWSKPANMGPPINTDGNDACISLSADGQKLLIYRSIKENFVSSSSGDIYISTLIGKSWSEPVRLPDQINSKGWEPSASLSSDQKILYFTSNRDGGFGGTDIYMVKKLPHGEWAMPMNLGPKINTPYDEDSPFIHPDGKTLYFSSKGHKTMGGFDIFITTLDQNTGEWSQPENVGYPISTAHDDIHFSWSADGKKIYFSSIRPEGYGDKDIYSAIMEKAEANLVVLKGIVSDSTDKTPMEAIITVVDGQSNEIVGVFNSNSETGKYLVVLPEGKNYVFSISAENYSDCSEYISVPQLGGFEVIEKDIKLCTKKIK